MNNSDRSETGNTLTIIGGGLAGCEAAWQAACRGIKVNLFEMRPVQGTGAHKTSDLAELVCSNSLGSDLLNRASGLLKEELRKMSSLLTEAAEKARVPAGNALAVDRSIFSGVINDRLQNHPNIHLIRQEVKEIPNDTPVIIASGPLTSDALADSLCSLTGKEGLFFFDAIAPIVNLNSIDMSIAWRASRYSDGEDDGDYINCPFTKNEYFDFVEALKGAERIPLRSFEEVINDGVTVGKKAFFEGCLPVEILAGRSPKALAFGPMRPVGLTDPRTGKRAYAVIQLRQDNIAGDQYNLVGFQTNLRQAEQQRVFRMIPGLEQAVFERYGQMHRNSYIAAPELLLPTLQLREYPQIFIAGQLAGIEGYMGNIASGLAAGINATRYLQGQNTLVFPPESMLGAILQTITTMEMKRFQPVKASFGIMPPLENLPRAKKERGNAYAERALCAIQDLIVQQPETFTRLDD